MPYFEDKTEILIRLLNKRDSIAARQGDTAFNFHYDPKQWSDLRAALPRIERRLNDEGFTPHIHSFADFIQSILNETNATTQMVNTESTANLTHEEYTQTIEYLLTKAPKNHPLQLESPIVMKILEIFEQAAAIPRSVVLLLDIEMLHSLLRISAFEQVLQGKLTAPTVFFYPGSQATGNNPSFLGIHTPDGNYRSTHIY